jgi:2-polyprenyl-6-methoxyphenol hydroxylase-like FAD-dependent oxidoreductase
VQIGKAFERFEDVPVSVDDAHGHGGRQYRERVRIVIVGGGIAGLGTALACARDGHEVTILERDDTPMPADAHAAFEWKRTGAPQVRHSHAFLARLRNLLRDRAPDVLEALLAAGATEMKFADNLPPTLTDHFSRPGDEDLVAIACRRTTFEWVLRRVVLAEDGVELRHGVAAQRLVARRADIPRVTSVDGIVADLVVDARGPRSSSDEWFAAIGARPVVEELHESGIVYFSRFYRATGDIDTEYAGPVAADLGYLKYAVFLGDNETFSITFAVENDDEFLRKNLLHTDAFETVAASIGALKPWRVADVSEPITDVHVMAGLRNRSRPLVDEAGPLVHGFTSVGDAAVCTNPLYGRGCSLAFVHACGLADALREHGTDPDGFARGFAEFTNQELYPWFRSAAFQDAQARELKEEVPAEDPRAFMQSVLREGLLPATRTSPIVFRAFVRWFNLLVTPEALLADAEVVGEVMNAYNDRDNRPPPPVPGPERDEMVSLLQPSS